MNDSREHILFTSLTLFLQKSFKEVTMKEIVDKTGLSKGAFYHYFSSKEQVFEEVISHFFKEILVVDYNRFSQESLYSFYADVLGQYEKNRSAIAKTISVNEESTFTNNFYYLLFDAMRMLPGFKALQQQQQKEELKTWKHVVNRARKNGEIVTVMTDEQVAKLFIYLSDGTNLNLILDGLVDKKKNELRILWDGLYNSLKTPDGKL